MENIVVVEEISYSHVLLKNKVSYRFRTPVATNHPTSTSGTRVIVPDPVRYFLHGLVDCFVFGLLVGRVTVYALFFCGSFKVNLCGLVDFVDLCSTMCDNL